MAETYKEWLLRFSRTVHDVKYDGVYLCLVMNPGDTLHSGSRWVSKEMGYIPEEFKEKLLAEIELIRPLVKDKAEWEQYGMDYYLREKKSTRAQWLAELASKEE